MGSGQDGTLYIMAQSGRQSACAVPQLEWRTMVSELQLA